MKFSNTKVLPIEIWEYILEALIFSPTTLVLASHVCVQWRHLAARICEKYCKRLLDQRLIVELREIVVTHRNSKHTEENDFNYFVGEEWIEIFSLYQETSLESNSLDKRQVVLSFESTINISVADPFLLVSTYNEVESQSRVHCFSSLDFVPSSEYDKGHQNLFDGLSRMLTFDVQQKIINICLLTLPTPVLLLSTSSDMKAVILPTVQAKTGKIVHGERLTQRQSEEERREKPKTKILHTNPQLKGHPKTSSELGYFLTQDSTDQTSLLLYEAYLPLSSPYQELNIHLKSRIRTLAPAYTWILARRMIKTMESSGHIRSYQLERFPPDPPPHTSPPREPLGGEHVSAPLRAESGLKKDLRYPNPTIFTKDRVFSSTLVSRDLLGYWHMDRDRDYWLVGDTSPRTSEKGIAEISLQQVTLGHEVKQVVTAIHCQRGMLFCGTEEGHLLGYKIPGETDTSNDTGALQEPPWLNVPDVVQNYVVKLGTLFTTLGMLVALGERGGRTSVLYIERRQSVT